VNDSTLKFIQYAQTPLPLKPKLAHWITVVDIGDNRLHLRGADLVVPLLHPLFVETFFAIKPLLDGNHSVEQITTVGGEKLLPTTIEFLLKMLRANGVLQEGGQSSEIEESSPETESLRQFFSHYTQNPDGMISALNKTRLGVIGKGQLKDVIINAASQNQIKTIIEFSIDEVNTLDLETKIKDVDFLIACSENTGYSFFESINTLCLKTGTRWMRVAIEGTSGLVGPTIIPYQTACFHCYTKRTLSNSTDPEGFEAYQSHSLNNNIPNNEGTLPVFWDLVGAEIVLEIVRIITGFTPSSTIGRCIQISPKFTRSEHDIFRLPRCSVCLPRTNHQEIWNLDSLIENDQS
jgi:bacteriocin biosynthesis cyclodehydratase domain-containing protein